MALKSIPIGADGIPQLARAEFEALNLNVHEKCEFMAIQNFVSSLHFWEAVTKTNPNFPKNQPLQITLHSNPDDPPDVTLSAGEEKITIEITAYPQNAPVIRNAQKELGGAGYVVPGVSVVGTNYREVVKYMQQEAVAAAPRFTAVPEEIAANKKYLQEKIVEKNWSRCDLLLLHGTNFLNGPELWAAKEIVQTNRLERIKTVVLLTAEGQNSILK